MAVYKRDIVDINLETGNIHRSFLKHSIGYKDAAADHFGIRVFRNGEPVNLTGVSVQGIFMPPQGDPIAITSGNIVNYNEAEVVLPQACYNYDGQFTLTIKLVDPSNAVTGTMRIVDGMVDNTHASGTVAPTAAVPGYEEVLATYEQAIAAINKTVRFDATQSLTDTQKATARSNISAPSVAEMNTAVGNEATARQNADALKVNISDIENDLTGTNAGKVLDARQGKVLDDKVSDVKSALDVLENDEYSDKTFANGDAYGGVGNQLISSQSTTACILLRSNFIEKYIVSKEGYEFKVFLTNSGNVIQSGGTSGNYVKEYSVPENNAYAITVVTKKTNSTTISTTEAQDNILFGFNATRTSELLKKLKNNIENQFSLTGTDLTWVNNQIDTTTGDISSANTARLACCEFLPMGDITCVPGGSMSIHMYNESFAYLGYTPTWNTEVTKGYLLTLQPTAKYFRILYKRDNGNPSPSGVSDYGFTIIYDYDVSGYIKKQYGDFTVYDKLQQGGLTATGLNDGTNTLRIRVPDYIPVTAGETYRVIVNPASADSMIQLSVSFYNAKDFVTARTAFIAFIAGRMQDIKIPTGATYMRVLVAFVGNGAITPTAVRNFVVQRLTTNKKDNYAIASNFMKNEVALEYVGQLPNDTQSFIIYDGKYYSFNNAGKLTVQDSSFATVSTKDLSVGHANGFQLGNNGKAYVSGWDDNTVYVLDMETLEITDTITLPTEGYTTCAIDDANEIAYIFQRNSYPTSEDVYSFIVYDYGNTQTIKTKQLPYKFAAMQGCDFADGRIIVLNGGGTSQIPNGFKVYDTDGNMLSSFILNSFSTNEPEGVFVDRDTFDVYMCFYYAPLFKIKTL